MNERKPKIPETEVVLQSSVTGDTRVRPGTNLKGNRLDTIYYDPEQTYAIIKDLKRKEVKRDITISGKNS